jgi:hypothetical protein
LIISCIGVRFCSAFRTRLCWWIWGLGLGSLQIGGLYKFKSNIRTVMLQHIITLACYSRWLYASLHHADFRETTACVYRTGNTSLCKYMNRQRIQRVQKFCPSHGTFQGKYIHEYRSIDIRRGALRQISGGKDFQLSLIPREKNLPSSDSDSETTKRYT